MKIAALIMAGGKGERFWPKSKLKLPKQFLSLMDDGETMIQKTVRRLSPLVEVEDIFVATNAAYKELVLQQIEGIPEENVLIEPVGKNTAPCIGLGAVHMQKRYGEDVVMVVLPSDAMIRQEEDFRALLAQAVQAAVAEKNLVTIGITPDSPNTGYGYIQYDNAKPLEDIPAYMVKRFVEKPNAETAMQYLQSGDYLWNSGMFIWPVSVILEQLHLHMPENYHHLQKIAEHIGADDEKEILTAEFTEMQSISIDYGVMEKASDIVVLPAHFDWDDVGSWLAVERMMEADSQTNVLLGDVIAVETSQCFVQNNSKLVALVGMEDTVVVNTDDVVLVCSKKHLASIPQVLRQLRAQGREELL